MWDRKELKVKGKAAYNANKIACIIAAASAISVPLKTRIKNIIK